MFQIVISFLIVAFGQPAWFGLLGLLSGAVGLALFWSQVLDQKGRFWKGTLFFTAVQLVQLSWLPNEAFQGKYIYIVWVGISLLWGLQFGYLCTYLRRDWLRQYSAIFALAGGWVLFEWGRLFIMTGFPWNPVGLSMTASIYPMQMVSIGGIYLLSFWVMVTNLSALRAGWIDGRGRALWLGLVVFPYLWGAVSLARPADQGDEAKVLIVQTGAYPRVVVAEEKWLDYGLNQWRLVLEAIKAHDNIDYLVLPEGFDPFFLGEMAYPSEQVGDLFEGILGQRPTASKEMVSPAYWGQMIAELSGAEVICGFDMAAIKEGDWRVYNAAVHFTPGDYQIDWQAKQVLLPMGEYIPGEWARSIAAQYGIKGSFTPGEKTKVLAGKIPLSISLCSEELYGNMIRRGTQDGARLLVNISNDIWYPGGLLPKQHFDHGRLRAVENGVCAIRACNAGISSVIDAKGAVLAAADEDHLLEPQALYVSFPITHQQTLYRAFGDGLVVGLSVLLIGFRFRRHRFF